MKIIQNIKKHYDNYKDVLILLIVNMLILFIATVVFTGENYTCDSYGVANNYEGNVFTYIYSYRFFGALLLKLINYTGHSPVANSTLDVLFFVVSLSFAVTLFCEKIVNLICQTKEKNNLSLYALTDISILLSIINLSSGNTLSFPECVTILAFGFVFCIFASSQFFYKFSLQRAFISVFFLICATGIFQQFIALFAVYAIAICIIKIAQHHEKNILKNFSFFVYPGVCGLTSGILYYFIAKFLVKHYNLGGNPRGNFNFSSITANIKYYINNIWKILKGNGTFSSYKVRILFACLTLLIFLIFFISAVIFSVKTKEYKKGLLCCFSCIVGIVCAFVPGLLENTEGHGLRPLLAYFALPFLCICGIAVFCKKKTVLSGLSIILAVLFSLNIFGYTKNEIEQKIGNETDRQWAIQIVSEIEKYEDKTGIEITVIETGCDPNSQLYSMDINWARNEIFNTFSQNRYFETKDMSTEKYEELFKNKEWKFFDADEQLVFSENTVYVCAY